MKYARMYCGRWWLAVGMMMAAVVLAALVWRGADGEEGPAAREHNGIAKAESLSRAFRAAAEKVRPTVVKIESSTKPVRIQQRPGQRRGENPFRGTPFEDFFDDNTLPGFTLPDRMIPRRQGVGSGVIIDAKGIILTNNHVVEGADDVTVELADGRQFKATDFKQDRETDLAVLRIEAPGPLLTATLGNSDAMEIGDWVLAIGSPFELTGTVSAGIISGKGRAMQDGQRTDFLQTDAAINPGNSGGPLVNLDGEVIGISTAIASNTGGYQGVGFAIPANLAKWVAGQLVERGNVARAYLGVQIAALDAKLAARLGATPNKGVVISEVFPESPAAAAGIQEQDVILTFAGRPVNDPRDLQEMVERSPAGSQQKAEIIRDGKPKTLTVVVKPLPQDFGRAKAPASPGRRPGESAGFQSEELGMEVGELTEELAERLGHAGTAGVLITGVDPDGIAAQARIGEGMLVLRVGNKPVKSVAEFKAAMKGQSVKEGVVLLIRTRNGNRFVVLQAS